MPQGSRARAAAGGALAASARGATVSVGATPGPQRLGQPARPRAVSFVASALVFQALLLAALSLLAVLATGELGWPPPLLEGEWRAAGLGLVLSLLILLAALGLLAMRPGAWLLAMTAQGLSLAHALADYALGQPDYPTMVLGILVVLALQQGEVRQAFREAHGQS